MLSNRFPTVLWVSCMSKNTSWPDVFPFTSPLPAWCLDRGDRMLYPEGCSKAHGSNKAALTACGWQICFLWVFAWQMADVKQRKTTFNFYLLWVKVLRFWTNQIQRLPAINPVRNFQGHKKGGPRMAEGSLFWHSSCTQPPLCGCDSSTSSTSGGADGTSPTLGAVLFHGTWLARGFPMISVEITSLKILCVEVKMG